MPRNQKNNAEYWSHKANQRNDLRVRAVRRKYGHEGYAVFNMFLELLCDADFFEMQFTEQDAELLAGDFEVEPDRLLEIIQYCCQVKLLEQNDGWISCPDQKKDLQPLQEKRQRERSKYLKQNDNNQPVSAAETTREVTNPTTETPQSKVKKSKVKGIEDINSSTVSAQPANAAATQKKDFDYGFVAPEFTDAFMMWIQYRKSIGKTFKTQQTIEANYALLLELSKSNPVEAAAIINQSIQNQYQGLFHLKNKESNARGDKKNHKSVTSWGGFRKPD